MRIAMVSATTPAAPNPATNSVLVRLSSEKLRRWGITPSQIDDILDSTEALADLLLLLEIHDPLPQFVQLGARFTPTHVGNTAVADSSTAS